MRVSPKKTMTSKMTKECKCKSLVEDYLTYYSNSIEDMLKADYFNFIAKHENVKEIKKFFRRVHGGPWRREPDDSRINQAILCLLYSDVFGECLMNKNYRGDTIISRGFAYKSRKHVPKNFEYHCPSNTIPFIYPTINLPRGRYLKDDFYGYSKKFIGGLYQKKRHPERVKYIENHKTRFLPSARFSEEWYEILASDYFDLFTNYEDWKERNFIGGEIWELLEQISEKRGSEEVADLAAKVWNSRAHLMAKKLKISGVAK